MLPDLCDFYINVYNLPIYIYVDRALLVMAYGLCLLIITIRFH